MKTEEGYIPARGGRVWYRSVGEEGIPLLCLHGGPGMTHNYIEPLEHLAGRRRVIFYDQLGCGKSDRPEDTSLWTVERFVAELMMVREALGLERLHLFGSSWGGMLAMQYILDHQPPLESLIMAGSPASMPRWVEGCARLLAELPQDTQQVIRAHEERGFTDCPEYQGAVSVFYQRHLCRLRPWPDGLERAFKEAGLTVYHTMNGPSEFTVTGTLKDWDIFGRLSEIQVPTLITGGRYDEIRPDHLQDIHNQIPNSELVIFEQSSHCPFYDEQEKYLATVNDFLKRVEGS